MSNFAKIQQMFDKKLRSQSCIFSRLFWPGSFFPSFRLWIPKTVQRSALCRSRRAFQRAFTCKIWLRYSRERALISSKVRAIGNFNLNLFRTSYLQPRQCTSGRGGCAVVWWNGHTFDPCSQLPLDHFRTWLFRQDRRYLATLTADVRKFRGKVLLPIGFQYEKYTSYWRINSKTQVPSSK